MTISEKMETGLDTLTIEYTRWCDVRNFPPMSADELLYEIQCTTNDAEQCRWLSDFIRRWDEAS